MKITSLEPQKKNARRYNIFLDNQFAFGADEDLVVDRRLIVGKEISKDDLPILLEEAEIGLLMGRMYGLLSRRARSEKEIRDYLKQLSFKKKIKGDPEISELVINELINKLKRKGLLNDLEFAQAWVESCSKKKGKNALKAELFNKGIDREIIDQVLENGGGEKQSDTAKKLLERKMKVWKNFPEMEFKQKALRFLVSRGFEYDLSKEIVEKALQEDYN